MSLVGECPTVSRYYRHASRAWSNPSLHLTFASLRLSPAGELKLQGLPLLSSKAKP